VIPKVSGTTRLTLQCVIPTDLNPQQYHSENLKSHDVADSRVQSRWPGTSGQLPGTSIPA